MALNTETSYLKPKGFFIYLNLVWFYKYESDIQVTSEN